MAYKYMVKKFLHIGSTAHNVMLRVYRVASLPDRWWLSIHQGAITPSHQDSYPDKFIFIFNRHTSKARGLLFHPLMEGAVESHSEPRKIIIGGKSQPMVDGLENCIPTKQKHIIFLFYLAFPPRYFVRTVLEFEIPIKD